MLCMGPMCWLLTTSPSSHPPHLTKQVSQPGFELNVNRQKVWEKGSVGWRPPAPPGLCWVFSCKPWLAAWEFSESVTQVSKYCDIHFQCGAFSVFPYLFGLKQFEEKFRSKQMAGYSGWSSQGVMLVVSQLENNSDDHFWVWGFFLKNLKKASSQLWRL